MGTELKQYWSLSVHFLAVPSVVYKYYISQGNGFPTTHGITVMDFALHMLLQFTVIGFV